MIAIISDVHGNYEALKAVLAELDKLKCKNIVSLGDVSGYYCMVNECIEEFRKRNVINILGNHDYYTLGLGACPRSNTVKTITEYQRKILSVENLEYLRSSVSLIDNNIYSARHGGWQDPLDEYVKDFDFSIADRFSSKVFCSGHTHIQLIKKSGIVTYFNPGSVGQPRDNDCRAAYAIIDDDLNIHLNRIEYNIDVIAENMKQAGFLERTYSCLYHGTKIGG